MTDDMPTETQSRGSLERLVRQRRYYPRPLTYQEWAHSAMFTIARPDTRSEFRKIRELIREGKLPNDRSEPHRTTDENQP